MKKIYAIVAFALVATASFGQRALDLELVMTTPVDLSTVPQTTTQQIKFTLENVGADLVAGDTIIMYIANYTTGELYNFDGEDLSVQGTSVNAVIVTAANANTINTMQIPSAILNGGSEISFNTTAAGFNLGDTILVAVELYATPAADPGDEAQSAMGNNFGEFYLSAPVASVANAQKIALKAFPVPTENELNITADEQVVSVSVINLEGKVISTTSGSKVDVSNLTSGVYMYEVTTVSGMKAVNKFVKK